MGLTRSCVPLHYFILELQVLVADRRTAGNGGNGGRAEAGDPLVVARPAWRARPRYGAARTAPPALAGRLQGQVTHDARRLGEAAVARQQRDQHARPMLAPACVSAALSSVSPAARDAASHVPW